MARKVKDKELDTRTARLRLKPRGKPYWRAVGPNFHVGYRRLKGRDGTWSVRRYLGNQQYAIEGIGVADDISDANNDTVLTWHEACKKAGTEPAKAANASPLTVRQAIESYITERDAREARRKGRSFRSDAHRLERYVSGREQRGKRKVIGAAKLADVAFHELTEKNLRDWRVGLPESIAVASRRRLISDLKAALNAAYAAHREELNNPLLPGVIKEGLKAPKGDDEESARANQILTDTEVGRLIQAARDVDNEQGWDGDLYRMIVALAGTGARFSQLARMKVADCQPANKRLLVPKSRKGKGKTGSTSVQVGADVLNALRPALTGRTKDALLFERWHHRQVIGKKWDRVSRGPWKSSSQFDRAWLAIRERANMPDVIPYALRHSSIVRGIRANLPIRLVAAMHDTSVEMIERHYGKWIVDGLEELAARAVVPLVPQEKRNNVTSIAG